MKVENLNNSVYQNHNSIGLLSAKDNRVRNLCDLPDSGNKVNKLPFKGGSNLSKRGWMFFGNLSDYMKEPSEMVSAIIQAIGTSIVAPIAILSSPNRNVHNEEEKEVAKEKKRFQAFRQPFSALIALCFQVPATIAIAKTFDHYAYENPKDFFNDETIIHLIPDKKYLARQAKKAMKESADSTLLEEWKSELEYARNTTKVKEDLINDIKKKYKGYGIELSDEKLEKMASQKKRIRKFVADKMASAKHDKLIDTKVEELKNKTFDIKDFDLVTEEDENLAKEKFKEKFKALKKEKLNWFDKCIKTMGFANGNVKKYNVAEDKLAKEKGLELLRTEKPQIFNNYADKFKQFIKNRDEHATKIYKNKKFWIQLATNLAMVAISCTVLNWMHPKFMDFLDGVKQAKKEEMQKRQSMQKGKVS